MTESLRTFLDGLIDYAGLFPPAKLELPQAVRTFARHLTSDYRWILATFICPVRRLEELASLGGVLRDSAPIGVSGLATRVDSIASLREAVRKDAVHISNFNAGEVGTVDNLEVRLPDDSLDIEISDLSRILEACLLDLRSSGCIFDRVFFEIERRPTWVREVERVGSTLAGLNREDVGFKLRTGGLQAPDYPDVEEIAEAVLMCLRHRLPMKFTAGLHHPVRSDRDGVTQHGFLNVFGAAVLAAAETPARSYLEEILSEREMDAFVFDSRGFAWRSLRAPRARLAALRNDFAISFGSCDFDEPIEDLKAAGLLE